MGKDKSVKIEKWAVAVMLVLGVLFYFVPGEWISIESDSVAYLYARGREGVLPGYPIFLSFFERLMGKDIFLNGVVIAQSLLAIVCTFIFVIVLQKQFKLKGWECVLLYVATMLPFSIYLPESGITHQIMTEGITYAIFYLYFITILKGVWALKIRWYASSLVLAFTLGIIRSQMLFLQAISFMLILWIVFKKKKAGFCRKGILLICTALIGVMAAFFSYKLIFAITIWDNQRIVAEEDTATYEEEQAEMEEIESIGGTAENVYVVRMEQDEMPSQFITIIVSRGFFEADKEDVALFEDKMMKDIFKRAYELADENGHLYHHIEPSLYMWEDLVYDGMIRYISQAISEYDLENPGERARDSASISREIGLRILFKHLDRYLYHVIRLMMPSFIASVFFQIKPIYLLCHFIALFIYLFAIIGAVWIVKRNGNRQVCEGTLTTVIFLITMIVVINMVFIGLQRYVVYGMGIFYCIMYLQIKELYLINKERIAFLMKKKKQMEKN